jgi:hypothetical protein
MELVRYRAQAAPAQQAPFGQQPPSGQQAPLAQHEPSGQQAPPGQQDAAAVVAPPQQQQPPPQKQPSGQKQAGGQAQPAPHTQPFEQDPSAMQHAGSGVSDKAKTTPVPAIIIAVTMPRQTNNFLCMEILQVLEIGTFQRT